MSEEALAQIEQAAANAARSEAAETHKPPKTLASSEPPSDPHLKIESPMPADLAREKSQIDQENPQKAKKATLDLERITTRPGLEKPTFKLSPELQQNLTDKFLTIFGEERLRLLRRTQEGKGVFFQQIEHVVKRLKDPETELRDSDVVIMLKGFQVYESLIVRGLALRTTNGGKIEGAIEVPAEEEVTKEVKKGSGLYRAYQWLREIPGVRVKITAVIREAMRPEEIRRIAITCEPTDAAVVSEFFRMFGAEGWEQDDFLTELTQIEKLNTRLKKAIGLDPLANLTDRAFNRPPNPTAGPETESGGYDAFENIRRRVWEELIRQNVAEGDTLQEKLTKLTPEQKMALWLESYNRAADQLFEDLSLEIEGQKDKKAQAEQQSRGARLEALGQQIIEGKAEKFTPDQIEEAQKEEREKQAELTAYQRAYDSLEGKKEQEGIRARLDKTKVEATTWQARLEALAGDGTEQNPGRVQKLETNIIDLEKELTGLKAELTEIDKKQNSVDWQTKKDEIDRKSKVLSALKTKLEKETTNLAEAIEKAGKTAVQLEVLEQEYDRLLKMFNIDTNAGQTYNELIIEQKMADIRAGHKKAQQELEKTTGVRIEGEETQPQGDKKAGEEIIRVGQIVAAKSEIKTKITEAKLEEIRQAVEQQDWQKAHDIFLELIFETTGKPEDQLRISRENQREILDQVKIAVIAARTLQIPQAAISENNQISFAKIAPELGRNLVQAQRVVGALIDELYYNATTPDHNLRATPTELQSTPTETPPESYESRTVKPIEIEIGKASYKKPSRVDALRGNLGQITTESVLPKAGGITARVETNIVKKDKIEVHVRIKADSTLYFELAKFNTGKDALDAGWDPTIVSHFFGKTSNPIKSQEMAADNRFIEIDLSTGPQRERKNFDEILAGLYYQAGKPLLELERLCPAAVAQMIYSEKNPVKQNEYGQIFAKFSLARFSAFGVDYYTVFREGQFLVTGKNSTTGTLVIENKPIDHFLRNYKKLYMNSKGITDETNLTPNDINTIQDQLTIFLAEIGKEALKALQR